MWLQLQDEEATESELDRREWKMQSADGVLHESGIKFHSQRMELYQAKQSTDQFGEKQSWLCIEVKMRDRALQEDRVKSFQEIKEL